MQVKEIMTEDPTCCSASTPLIEVAQLMVRDDCGCIPVVDDNGRPLGVVTDRDITCRVVAQRKNPEELLAQDCMTTDVVTIAEDASLEECRDLMEENQIRRVLAVDGDGCCCGVVSQADFATEVESWTGEIVEAVSRPTDTASNVLH